MSLLLHIIVTYIKKYIITKLQKLYSQARNPWADHCKTSDLSPVCKIFIERPVTCKKRMDKKIHIQTAKLIPNFNNN